MKICFDMDGTLADFYSVPGWLDSLLEHDARPYKEAKPLVNCARIAHTLNALQAKGHKLVIISWGSKDHDSGFLAETAKAKKSWLRTYFPSVKWDEIHIVQHGYPKSAFADSDSILFDDEAKNRYDWSRKGDCLAFNVHNIETVLNNI